MAREDLSPTYASPGLRWGIFKEDYPMGTYVFSVVKGTELDPPVPESFGGDLDFVVAVIDRNDGSPQVTGYKEIPAAVKRWTGNGNSRRQEEVPFERTPDNWQVLTTKALGRALKRAGYPDDTKDLKALMLWRQRRLELKALEMGIDLTPVQIGPGQDEGRQTDLDQAGTVDRYGDRELDPEHAGAHPDIEEAQIVDPVALQWHADVKELMLDLPPDTIRQIHNTAVSRGIDVEAPGDKLGRLLAIVRGSLPKDPPRPAEPPKGEEKPPEGGTQVPADPKPPSRGPGTAEAAPAPPPRRPTQPPPRDAVLQSAVAS